ncbi:MAG: hypothetical protein ACYCTL_06600 [Acidimicrobiales bacterium]
MTFGPVAPSEDVVGWRLMFVRDFVEVPVPFDQAARVLAEGDDAWLDSLAGAAVDEEGEHLLNVGLTDGGIGPSKTVRVTTARPTWVGGELMVPVVWSATGVTWLFPVLDVNLVLGTMGNNCSQLAIEGRYDPPLGVAGRILDRSMLHRVAEATIRCFLVKLARSIGEVAAQSEAGSERGMVGFEVVLNRR